MRLAIMQPYFFPYIGYWQLIHAVDRFVIYDDVNYIKGGWVNRNRILINGMPCYITAPLNSPSPFKRICDITLHDSRVWRDKLVKSIEMSYAKEPNFASVFPLIEKLIRYKTDNLSEYLANQIQSLSLFMGIKTELIISSCGYGNQDLSGQARVLDICMREGATTYINLQGGQAIYDDESFRKFGLDLNFITMDQIPYRQRAKEFIPGLSIIDALMRVGANGIRQHLDAFELIAFN